MRNGWKTWAAIGAIAVVAYLAYQWYQNNYGSGSNSDAGNIGSDAFLTEGGAGSDSGLTYNAGSTTVNLGGGEITSGGGNGGASGSVKVPNVVGMSQATAYGKITAAGLKPSGSKTIKGKTLTVDSQSPKAGAMVAKGSTVTLQSAVKPATQSKKLPPVKGANK